jgi:deoxyribonuclease V
MVLAMLKHLNLHPWDVSPKEAVRIQKELRERIIPERDFDRVSIIAGADVSFSKERREAKAAVVVFSFPELTVIEKRCAISDVTFPYVPGLLTFREGPPLISVFDSLKTEPDLIVFDAHGIAHPRGMGLASHMGLVLDKPTIGCAKSRLCGTYENPGEEQGSYSYLRKDDEILGAVLRTKRKTKPVFVSIGHNIDLEISVEIVLRCLRGYRLPEPTRQAHLLAGQKA